MRAGALFAWYADRGELDVGRRVHWKDCLAAVDVAAAALLALAAQRAAGACGAASRDPAPLDPPLWAVFAACALGGPCMYLLCAGGLYRRYYQTHARRMQDPAAWKVQPGKFLPADLFWKQFATAVKCTAAGGGASAFWHLAAMRGETAIYWHPPTTALALMGALLVFIVDFVVVDFLEYWVHYMLHHPAVYRHVHKAHHIFYTATPLTAFAVHPLETLAHLSVFSAVCSMSPLWFPLYALMVAVQFGETLFNHLGTTDLRLPLPWRPFLLQPKHHEYHHKVPNVNYGAMLECWDRIFGTEYIEMPRSDG